MNRAQRRQAQRRRQKSAPLALLYEQEPELAEKAAPHLRKMHAHLVATGGDVDGVALKSGLSHDETLVHLACLVATGLMAVEYVDDGLQLDLSPLVGLAGDATGQEMIPWKG